jgi:hypothetical protein
MEPPQRREATMFHLSSRGWVLAFAFIAFSSLLVSTVQAEVHISGSADAIQIEVDNATLDEILNKLRAEYNLQIRATEALQARINGSYRGSLREVLSRLLDGYNYVIKRKREPGALDVIVIGSKGTQSTTPNLSLRAPNASPSRGTK